MEQQSGACTEKTRLSAELSHAAEVYVDSVSLLVQSIGAVARTEYARLQLANEEARGRAEQARLALENHTREHGC